MPLINQVVAATLVTDAIAYGVNTLDPASPVALPAKYNESLLINILEYAFGPVTIAMIEPIGNEVTEFAGIVTFAFVLKNICLPISEIVRV